MKVKIIWREGHFLGRNTSLRKKTSYFKKILKFCYKWIHFSLNWGTNSQQGPVSNMNRKSFKDFGFIKKESKKSGKQRSDPDPDLYFMRMRIRVPKMMRIWIYNTAAYQWVECRGIFWRAQWRSSRRASGSDPSACTHPLLWREPAQKPINQLSTCTSANQSIS